MSEIAHIAATLFKRAHHAQRFLVAIAGPPGAGKSRLAAELHDILPEGTSAVVPMDGFHFDNAVLEQRGLSARKGAPETFDFAGFEALLKRHPCWGTRCRHPGLRPQHRAVAGGGGHRRHRT